MATEALQSRRRLLAGAAAWGLAAAAPAWASSTPTRSAHAHLAAAWDDAQGRHFAGVLAVGAEGLRVGRALELPTRAHGVSVAADGTLTVAARRPGPWLLRWHPNQHADTALWQWLDADRRLCGHSVLAGGQLLSTETDLADGQGLLVQRDPVTLAVREEWATQGIDPHELLRLPDGGWLVANGGVPTLPETGRAKLDLQQMEASLVRLNRQGRVTGQWRLSDRRLSLRHLALHADGSVGVALQAEHDDAQERALAPLLAVFDGHSLRPVAAGEQGGYAGSVLATRQGFIVAATRAGRLLHFQRGAAMPVVQPLPQACALARVAGAVLAGGEEQALAWNAAGAAGVLPAPALRLDNHWTEWRTG